MAIDNNDSFPLDPFYPFDKVDKVDTGARTVTSTTLNAYTVPTGKELGEIYNELKDAIAAKSSPYPSADKMLDAALQVFYLRNQPRF